VYLLNYSDERASKAQLIYQLKLLFCFAFSMIRSMPYRLDFASLLIRAERKWHLRLSCANYINKNGPCLPSTQRKLITIITATLLFYKRRNWHHIAKDYWIFISFSGEDLSSGIQSFPSQKIIRVNAGFKCLTQKTPVVYILESIYYLLHDQFMFPRLFRKLLLGLLFNWVEANKLFFFNNIFFVKGDFYGASSILVSLSRILNIRVIGIQHGLMSSREISKQLLYPGIRTKIEFVYSKYWRNVLDLCKPKGSCIYVVGPPFDCGTGKSLSGADKSLIFVSSSELISQERVDCILTLRSFANLLCWNFLLRPHPHEKQILRNSIFKLDLLPSSRTLQRCLKSTVFIGYYSTLMYAAACKGFKTIWIYSKSAYLSSDHFDFIDSLPNSAILPESAISVEKLGEIYSKHLETVESSFFLERIHQRLSTLDSNYISNQNFSLN